jgi:organic radical activating enzyme
VDDYRYEVVEIFDSLEGEGSWMGRHSAFVRLHGCNLRCAWCDSTYAHEEVFKGEHLTAGEIVERVRALEVGFVTLTGGEPFLCEQLPQLADALIQAGLSVKIETNGTRYQAAMAALKPKSLFIACSPKPPEYAVHPRLIEQVRELRFVVDSELRVMDLLRPPFYEAYRRGVPFVLQLQAGEAGSLARAKILQKKLFLLGYEARILPQMHKLLGID